MPPHKSQKKKNDEILELYYSELFEIEVFDHLTVCKQMTGL